MDPIIRIDHLSFSYGEASARALDDVTLSVNPGFLGIIGPSGAGKTTLASAMSGAIPHHYTGPLFGSVLVDGKDTCAVTLTDISQVVGSVLQDIDTQMVASVVEDEMLFGLENFGVPHDQIEERIAQTLETVGISDLREREIATLSGGQKQKVAIAAILAMHPRVLVLDEPTAALDPASSTLVFDTLRKVREESVTVVVIEQKVALLSEYCDRILVMSKGSLVLDGTPREVFSHGDELRRIGVDSPRVARISNSLAARGLIEGRALPERSGGLAAHPEPVQSPLLPPLEPRRPQAPTAQLPPPMRPQAPTALPLTPMRPQAPTAPPSRAPASAAWQRARAGPP